MNLTSDAEKTMLDFVVGKIKKNVPLTLVGERTDNSPLRISLESRGYKILDVYTADNPMNSRTNFESRMILGTRPCDFYKGDLSEKFLRACKYWNCFFVLIPCSCWYKGMNFQKKISYYVRKHRNIESVDSRANWIILHNLDKAVTY